MTATVTIEVRLATASRRLTIRRHSPTPRCISTACALRLSGPGSPTATLCTAMRSSLSRGRSGGYGAGDWPGPQGTASPSWPISQNIFIITFVYLGGTVLGHVLLAPATSWVPGIELRSPGFTARFPGIGHLSTEPLSRFLALSCSAGVVCLR